MPAGTKQITLGAAGLLSVQLVPNVGATPTGTRYTVAYRLDNGQPHTVSWTVPASGPVTVTAIESTTLVPPSSVVALSQLGQGGATLNQCIVWGGAMWTAGSCAAAGNAFSGISGGTNTSAAMVVGSGATLDYSGTGVIDATKILGTTLTGITGLVKMTSGLPSAAVAETDYSSPLTFSNGLSRSVNAVSGLNAAADGSTKGVAAFTANDFTASSGVISLNYASGQKATTSVPGFLSAADWTTFNGKQAALSVVNDTNVTGAVAGGTLTLGWTGTLAKGRIIGTAVYNDQANTYSAGLQDLHSATARFPETVVGSLPAAASNTNHVYVVTDGTSASDCVTGGGSTRALCISNGSAWVALGGGSGGAGTVTHSLGALTLNSVIIGNGGADVAAGPVFSGNATDCLTGAQTFTPCRTGNYTQAFSSQTSVILTHNLNSTGVVVQCFDGGAPPQYIEWNTLQITNANSVTVTFTTAQSGTCVVNATLGAGPGPIGGVNIVSFSATPVFNLLLGQVQKISLTGNVSSSTVSNGTAGVTYTFEICNDGTGSRTWTWPATFIGGMAIGATPSTCNVQPFEFDGSNYYATSVGLINQ